ncbi:MAG: hypothetical protein LBH14_03485 [Desulfobulbaceae bacterium]|jgi:hypothetical protein|nr:hypothetical protein [Desulfobulbaceae bacterium]
MDPYNEAHLFVAAIRVLRHQKNSPPSVEEVGAMLRISDEAGHALRRKLEALRIIETVADPFTVKMTVANHLALENLPRQEEAKDALARELERFQAEKKSGEQKISSLQAEFARKQQEKLAGIEAMLKKEMERRREG